jgi:hypothetical protein
MPAILAHLTETFVIGNFMSEAIYPTLLHQDPRYFQGGIGSTRARLGPSIGQIFWTHTDSHRTQFNYLEILVERPEGILARCKPEVLQEESPIVRKKPREQGLRFQCSRVSHQQKS